MNKTNNWKEIEEEFIEKYPYMSMLIDDEGQYVNPRAILRFFKPYFQEKMHELSVSELEIVDNNPKE